MVAKVVVRTAVAARAVEASAVETVVAREAAVQEVAAVRAGGLEVVEGMAAVVRAREGAGRARVTVVRARVVAARVVVAAGGRAGSRFCDSSCNHCNNRYFHIRRSRHSSECTRSCWPSYSCHLKRISDTGRSCCGLADAARRTHPTRREAARAASRTMATARVRAARESARCQLACQRLAPEITGRVAVESRSHLVARLAERCLRHLPRGFATSRLHAGICCLLAVYHALHGIPDVRVLRCSPHSQNGNGNTCTYEIHKEG